MSPTLDESVFEQAIRLPVEQRTNFVRSRYAQDQDGCQRMLRMLQAHEQTNSFLDACLATESESADSVAEGPGQMIGPYKLREEIGRGGMGVVFVAEREQPFRQKVALKIIKPGMDSQDIIARFAAERQALALMDHPNIAKVLDAGFTHSGRPYFVMELVKGIPITEYCDQHQLTVPDRVDLISRVCRAIHHAHQKGIIHRDMKPTNVLVTEHDGLPVPKVIDFGVAKAVNQRLTEHSIYTQHRQVVGTLQYMSPEQSELSGLDIDTRTDVYSLGLLLYELVAGQLPFDRERFSKASFDEKRRIIREEEPPKPSTKLTAMGKAASTISDSRRTDPARLQKQLKGDLDWIVMKSLEKDRSRRYESALAMAQDVDRFLLDQPVLAGPPGPIYRLQKFGKRHRGMLGASAFGLIVVILLTAWGVNQWAAKRNRVIADSNNLNRTLDQASVALGIAQASPIGQEGQWAAARAYRQQIAGLLETSHLDPPAQSRAREYLQRFDVLERDRQFAAELEQIVINRSTQLDRDSWLKMEREIRELFAKRGMSLDQLDPDQVADRIRQEHASAMLTDALELWIATRGHLAVMGGPAATEENMQPWADAIYRADDDPLRTGIRRIIYERRRPELEELRSLHANIDLRQVSARTLSWLATVYSIGGEFEESNRIHQLALRVYPDDMMLNFDYALNLAGQQDWEKAIRYFLRCSAIRPRVAGIWRELGIAYRQNDELDASRDSLEYSDELEPDNPPTLIELALTMLRQNEATVAEETARRILQLDSESADARAILGYLMIRNGQLQAGLEHLRWAHEHRQSAFKTGPFLDQWMAETERKKVDTAGQDSVDE